MRNIQNCGCDCDCTATVDKNERELCTFCQKNCRGIDEPV